MPSACRAAAARPPDALADVLPCQRGEGELWFSELPAELEQAKASCQQCPLRTACLAGALQRAELRGAWAARSSTREPSSRARGRAGDRPGPGPMSAKATAAAQRPREEIMHPSILQQLAAEHVKDQLATADDMRRARQARRARSRPSRKRTRLSLPGSQARHMRGLTRRGSLSRRRRWPAGHLVPFRRHLTSGDQPGHRVPVPAPAAGRGAISPLGRSKAGVAEKARRTS